MATIADLRMLDMVFVQAYPWWRVDPVSRSPLVKPLSASRMATVSSAGRVQPAQEPLDATVRGGNFGYREIPGDCGVRTLIETHRSRSFDPSGVARDPNLAIPLDRLREVALRVRPPRALCVPIPHGFPLGESGNVALQRAVIEATLRLPNGSRFSPPVLRDFALEKAPRR